MNKTCKQCGLMFDGQTDFCGFECFEVYQAIKEATLSDAEKGVA